MTKQTLRNKVLVVVVLILAFTGYKAKQKNEEFLESYAQMINKLTLEFSQKFCDDGKINWVKLIKYNSGFEKLNYARNA